MHAGFTKQRRAEDNLTVLKECIEADFIGRRQLIAIAISYKRAYDSIKGEKIITVLKYYKIDTKIIDSIVRIYENDSTNIKLREGINQNFKITSGIRQGCTQVEVGSSATHISIIYYSLQLKHKTQSIGYSS